MFCLPQSVPSPLGTGQSYRKWTHGKKYVCISELEKKKDVLGVFLDLLQCSEAHRIINVTKCASLYYSTEGMKLVGFTIGGYWCEKWESEYTN